MFAVRLVMTFHQMAHAHVPHGFHAPTSMYAVPAYRGGVFRGMGNDPIATPVKTTAAIAGVVVLASAAASAYHGYKRNDSVGSAVGWFFLGGIFPIITPAIALAQGFGKPKSR